MVWGNLNQDFRDQIISFSRSNHLTFIEKEVVRNS